MNEGRAVDVKPDIDGPVNYRKTGCLALGHGGDPKIAFTRGARYDRTKEETNNSRSTWTYIKNKLELHQKKDSGAKLSMVLLFFSTAIFRGFG
jgi:hypothetical protein